MVSNCLTGSFQILEYTPWYIYAHMQCANPCLHAPYIEIKQCESCYDCMAGENTMQKASLATQRQKTVFDVYYYYYIIIDSHDSTIILYIMINVQKVIAVLCNEGDGQSECSMSILLLTVFILISVMVTSSMCSSTQPTIMHAQNFLQLNCYIAHKRMASLQNHPRAPTAGHQRDSVVVFVNYQSMYVKYYGVAVT